MSSRKHYDPKFRKERAAKSLWVDQRYRQTDENLTFDQHRKLAKQQGIHMPKEDKRFKLRNDSSTADQSARIQDRFVPYEADGRFSVLTRKGLNHLTRDVPRSKLSNLRSKRVLKKYEDGFNKKEMANELQSVYVQTINLLNDFRRNEEKLLDYLTLHGFQSLLFDFKKRTVQWKFLETVEPPKIVAIRTFEESLKDNLMTQITLRIYSKQTLAVYDQFGRIMLGDPNLVKTVLEFVVFEKHIVDTYGRWRVHGKIIPDWMKPQSPLVKTSLEKDNTKEEED